MENGLEIVSKWLEETFDSSSQIILVDDSIPNAARHKAAMNMAFQNAREDIIRRLRERGDTPALEELKTLFSVHYICF